MTDTNIYVIGLIAAISAAFTAWAANRWSTNTSAALVETYTRLGDRVTDLEDQAAANYRIMSELRNELDQSLREQKRLLNGINRLIEQLKAGNIQPVWTPESRDT
jgi:hypothetical protein